LRADHSEIVESGTVAAEKKMVAVVDPAAEFRVVIGSATSAGMWGGFVHDNGATGT
jgi:peptidyl-tRNA hydrolase